MTGPWTTPDRVPSATRSLGQKIGIALGLTLALVVIGAAALVARRNIRMGRGDLKGAMRIAIVNAGVGTVRFAFGTHHVADVMELYLFFGSFLAFTLLTSGFFWMLYVALEPFARRKMPQTLTAWTRLLTGEWRDPRVGRDVLVGIVAGTGLSCLDPLQLLIASALGFPERVLTPPPQGIMGPGSFISSLTGSLAVSAAASLLYLSLVFLFKVNRMVGAMLALVPVIVAALTSQSGVWFLGAAASALAIGIAAFLLVRFGLVSMMAAFFANAVLNRYPITFQSSAWYASYGYAALLVLAAIAFYGFRTSLAGRRVLENLPEFEGR